MKILVVSTSTRANSQSRKVADVLLHKLQEMDVDSEILDLHEAKLPIYDDTKKPEWEPISEKLREADGYLWVIPEWSGTAGPGIMNLITYIDAKGLISHKPILLASVSSGAGGSYPLAQIKAFGMKNTRGVIVPESLRFRQVEDYFNSLTPDVANKTDIGLHERSEYALKILVEYAKALHQVRQSGSIDPKAYPSGQ